MILSTLTHSDWVSLVGSIGGALIAALVALFVVYLQNGQQLRKEADTELDKLKYLYFLLNDTYKVVNVYDSTATLLINSFNTNPFVIPKFGYYPSHSLVAIATKINQEEYYLAAVNQLNSSDVAELLLACNTLNTQYQAAFKHYETETPKLIENKVKLEKSLEETNNVIDRLLKEKHTPKSGDQVIAYQRMQALLNGLPEKRNSFKDSDEWLLHTQQHFLDPLDEIINSTNDENIQYLRDGVRDVRTQYNGSIIHMRNVIESIRSNRDSMNTLIIRIKHLAIPLNEKVESTLPKISN